MRQATDHVLGPNPLKGLPDSRIINGLIPHGHIRSNSSSEKIRVLKHNPHFLTNTLTGIVANGLAINENLAFLGVIEAEQEINHRTLTRPRMPHQGNGLTWLSQQIQIFQDGLARYIGKVNMLELDLTLRHYQVSVYLHFLLRVQ